MSELVDKSFHSGLQVEPMLGSASPPTGNRRRATPPTFEIFEQVREVSTSPRPSSISARVVTHFFLPNRL